MPEAQGCLKSLLDEAPAFPFTRQEWLEILLRACREGLGAQAERAAAAIAARFRRDGPAMALLVQAEAARVRKQGPAVMAAIDQLLAQPTADPGLVALGRQIKGEYFHFSGQHVPALAELKLALAYGRAPVDVVAAQYRLMRSAAEAGYEAEAVKAAQWLGRAAPTLPVLPVHLFEMGLQRYDAGRLAEAVPYFLTLARACPGHHRADDALGYAARALGLDRRDGRDLLALLRRVYPHSFFVYWLDPAARTAPMPQAAARPPALPASLKKRIPAWRALLKSPFDKFARDEIFGRLDEAPGDPALTWAASEAAIDAHDYFLVTAFGERFLKAWLDEGKTGAQVPSWVWPIYYPRPYWDKVQLEARKYGLDPWWVLSIMREESHFNPNILSRSNAHGLMQILPSTGKWIADKLGLKERFDKNSLWNTDRNIAFGTWYLGYLRDLFNGDLFLAAAAYNGGQGNILRKVEQGPYAHLPVLERLDRVPLPETRDYYKKVMGSWWNYRRLYEK
jgi:soluble lytic murein transglycosylase